MLKLIKERSREIVDDTKSYFFFLVKTFFIALLIAFLVRHFLFHPTVVKGESMSPTFESDDKVLVNKLSEIERFDIVVFDAPDEDVYYVKRVIGVPGDTVEMIDDVLYINGKAMNEPYLDENRKKKSLFGSLTPDFTLEDITGETKVPDQTFFVLGDNRVNSKDSRAFGFVPEESIIGEVKLQVYPLNEIGVPK